MNPVWPNRALSFTRVLMMSPVEVELNQKVLALQITAGQRVVDNTAKRVGRNLVSALESYPLTK